jgi:AmmeMemoRadiSam system protein B
MSVIRPPAVAGRFYPDSREECARAVDEMTRPIELERRPVGAVVPHAGWVYSGPTAALAIAALAKARPETIVIFGAVHTLDSNDASVYPAGGWETPLGIAAIDEDLADRFARSTYITADAAAHRHEHSIEVQVPIVQRIMGNVRIVPISVRPGRRAVEIGQHCAEQTIEAGRPVVFLASTDLTHYGPHFGFEPHGHGEQGVLWAKEVNDRRFIDLISSLDAEAIVAEAAASHNACGAGAVAAAIAAARVLGSDQYTELEHTTSADREMAAGGRPTTAVGYEAGVFTIPD